MKRPGSFLLLLCLLSLSLAAQQKPLDFEALENWPSIWNEQISDDGKWVTYTIRQKNRADVLVMKSTDNAWEKKVEGATNASIAGSNVVYQEGKDSIVIYDLANDAVKKIIPGNTYKISGGEISPYLACYSVAGKSLIVMDLSGNGWHYESVTTFEFSGNGKALLVENISPAGIKQLNWVDLPTAKMHTIAIGAQRFGNFVFEGSARLAFIAETTGGTQLRYFKPGMDSAIVKADNKTAGLQPGYFLKPGTVKFNKSGDQVFFIVTNDTSKPAPKNPQVADVFIWRYDDDYLPTERAAHTAFRKSYIATVPVNGNTITQLSREGDAPNAPNEVYGNFIIVKSDANYFSVGSKPSNIPHYYLVNSATGKRKLLIAQRDAITYLSPAGKYAIWFNTAEEIYYTCETSTGRFNKIATSLKGSLKLNAQSQRTKSSIPWGVAGWLPGDSAVLIYDEFDIWKVDPTGKKQPVNITRGAGRKSNTMLRIWNENGYDYETPAFTHPELLLAGFDTDNKQTGFYSLDLHGKPGPLLLSSGPRLYYAHARFYNQFLQSAKIEKAKNASVYILRPSRADSFPNITFTRDFKTFTRLSSVFPEQHYNWLTTELIKWKGPKGNTYNGVLYKPQDFDPSRKYPVLFYCYERLSHRLHQYMEPSLSEGSINIPFYASNGYLVFTPDITYDPGKTGEGALNAVVSAAKHLSKLHYVDSTKIGIQGHSFGGYQVNYIIANSNIFAAAQESAGSADFVSHYNSQYREASAQFYFEWGQGRMGATLWDKPEIFIKNSPLFNAPKLTTPLLIMHNKEDGEVPFNQAIEWFSALRRLGKKVWMLQYDKEYHGINQRKNKLDFTIKQFEFFEHYLKGKPAPGWMHGR